MKTCHTLIRFGPAALLLVVPLSATRQALFAQASVDSAAPMTVPNSHIHDFRSRINGRPYRLFVRLPPTYSARPAVRYPVLYMTDGGIAVPTAATAYQVQNGGSDSLIFVGIAYSDGEALRYRVIDYLTPPAAGADSVARQRAADAKCCQAAVTARVMREEIIPLVERLYRTTDDRGILGHSAGGMFAAYLLFAEPDLFRRYGITSPSPWTDNASLFEHEAQYARTHTPLPKRVFISVGSEEGPYNRYTAARLTATLRARRYDGLELTSVTLSGAQHGSMVEYSYALRVLYPPRSWIETWGNAAVKDSGLQVVRRFTDAYTRGDTVRMRAQLVTDSAFQGIVDGKIVEAVDQYLVLARVAANATMSAFRIDTLYAASDDPKNALFTAAYSGTSRGTLRAGQPLRGILTLEVVRRPVGWRIAYVLDTPLPPPQQTTVVRVEAEGVAVSGAEVSVESTAGRIVAARTDAAGHARLAFDWHLDWTKSSYLLVKAVGFQPGYAPPPNHDSVTVTLKRDTLGKP